jgi:hypothetical protein
LDSASLDSCCNWCTILRGRERVCFFMSHHTSTMQGLHICL